jgi:hypothetical protein
VSDNDFWVDPNGLARSAKGFADKHQEISSIVRRITALNNPTLVATAAGSDGGGKQFLAAHLDGATQLREGVQTWATAVGATGTGIHTTARNFGAVENTAAEAAKRLHNQT